MKLLFAVAVFCVTLGNAATITTEITTSKEKGKKEAKAEKKSDEEKASKNKNMHSIKKWNMIIEYKNGGKISKTIIVNKDSELSALETAFEEAEKYLKKAKNIKNYNISPATNSYVVLAGE
ncbi:hypothetical protein [Aquimarina pacifica]|uniref:hypothetical protein n=1 Tax=Aquimarina pacifica TaxID=1296415 RepID=UPI00047081E7|nr:hypothetical protein [Aquimarina pacifica]